MYIHINPRWVNVLERLASVLENKVSAIEAPSMPTTQSIPSIKNTPNVPLAKFPDIVNPVLGAIKSLEYSREFQSQVTGPVEAGYRQTTEFSKKGIILGEAEIDQIATQVAGQQLSAKANMKGLRPKVDEGLLRNAKARLGELYVEANDKITNQGTRFWNCDAFGR